ncbi:MAG: DUF565 domain-containing protein [Cyanophyceae cyanobacterium]
MQRTRLNTLVDLLSVQINRFLSNPWRRVSLLLISLLFGIFMGSAVSTTAGQDAVWDVLVAALLLLLTEAISIFFYRRRGSAFGWTALNAFKVGLTYSLYLEAFKLGS